MIRRPPRSTQSRSSAASDVYKRQVQALHQHDCHVAGEPGRLEALGPLPEHRVPELVQRPGGRLRGPPARPEPDDDAPVHYRLQRPELEGPATAGHVPAPDLACLRRVPARRPVHLLDRHHDLRDRPAVPHRWLGLHVPAVRVLAELRPRPSPALPGRRAEGVYRGRSWRRPQAGNRPPAHRPHAGRPLRFRGGHRATPRTRPSGPPREKALSMSAYREFTGKSVEEALRHAREEFGVGLDELDFEILTPGSRGVLGMGAEPARIVAAPRTALGGAAPKREAAAARPLPAPMDRGPRRDDPPAHGDAPRRDDRPDRPAMERPDAPRPDAPRRDDPSAHSDAPRRDAPRRDAPRSDAPRRDDRPERTRDRGPRRDDRPPRRSDDRPGVSVVSSSEADEVQTARSLVREREELQAAEASPAALDAGKRLLEQLMQHLGFSVAVNIETGETNRLNVVGADDEEHEALGALIGRKGERLSALQHIVNLMLSREMGEWTRVLVDVEGYRGPIGNLPELLLPSAAARVVETGKMLQLEPMPALERRWIHLALRNHPAVGTQSIGEEPNRRVVVVPKAVV